LESTTATQQPLLGPVGILGGTFDPVHLGHLLLAEQAREQLRLNHILWIPAATAPHPQIKQSTQMNHRLEMVRLATAGNPHFSVDDREIVRGGSSYTVDTLTELHQEFPMAEWVLLMGADSLSGFPLWRDPHRICQLSRVVVLARGGHPPPDLRILAEYLPDAQVENHQNTQSPLSLKDTIAEHWIGMPQCEVSSTDIRRRVAASLSIRYMVPAAVEAYIQTHGLYRASDC